ncbi:hypothetical protein VZT92_004569 [Zoarces viviparus]|uniref:Folliculin n=1 Tax=Zoarces viviparus TaxID=48416 RepID=A0AAW1FZC5_ZOAVI
MQEITPSVQQPVQIEEHAKVQLPSANMDTCGLGSSSAGKSALAFRKLLKTAMQSCETPSCGKRGTSIQEHDDTIISTTQPHLLAVGMKRSTIHEFFIVLDKQVIPCKSTSSLGAFDEHFVFGTMYSQLLHNMYTFVQTTVYNIDIGKVQESPRVAEIRARLLQ